MTVHVQLHDRLDYQSVPPLLSELKAIEDDEIVIDAGQVRHLGALSLQVLLSTIKSRHEAGKSTQFTNASDSCVDMLGLFGFTPENLTEPETWT
ncbi:STAS domain-containing protein [Pacificibacter marinus]|uniref:STAS domain-containing protein n=1 Tax=Pacificibacter marinus TaxID=658057 RepID=UPI001C06EEDC|nr:STAS domain-containing protein [Pacificibacter marinus]MBU2866495.1 STAS domain-containing protein [Pacificibacter marinus]